MNPIYELRLDSISCLFSCFPVYPMLISDLISFKLLLLLSVSSGHWSVFLPLGKRYETSNLWGLILNIHHIYSFFKHSILLPSLYRFSLFLVLGVNLMLLFVGSTSLLLFCAYLSVRSCSESTRAMTLSKVMGILPLSSPNVRWFIVYLLKCNPLIELAKNRLFPTWIPSIVLIYHKCTRPWCVLTRIQVSVCSCHWYFFRPHIGEVWWWECDTLAPLRIVIIRI